MHYMWKTINKAKPETSLGATEGEVGVSKGKEEAEGCKGEEEEYVRYGERRGYDAKRGRKG